jgi:hypothetical protein
VRLSFGRELPVFTPAFFTILRGCQERFVISIAVVHTAMAVVSSSSPGDIFQRSDNAVEVGTRAWLYEILAMKKD